MTFRLRPPLQSELADVSALCLRSKAWWGYDKAFMDACVEELTLTPGHLAKDQLIIAEDEIGMAGLAHVEVIASRGHLHKLFIDPERIGQGAGQVLYDWAISTANQLGAKDLIVVSDPNAAAFYEHMGGRHIDNVASGSIAGRELPRYILPLG